MSTDPRVHRLRIAEMNVPAWMRGLRLSSPSLPQGEPLYQARIWVDEFRDHYVTSRRELNDYPDDPFCVGRGLFFAGLPGVGKTMLAVATIIEVYYTWPKIYPYFITMADLIEARLHYSDDPDAAGTMECVTQSPVLVLDDVGKEHSSKSGWSATVLDQVLRYRHNEGRPTIITTNLALPKWAGYNESMESFIARSTDTYVVTS